MIPIHPSEALQPHLYPLCESLEQRVLLSAAVEGSAWTDLDGNGVRDAGEGPLKGLVVYSDENSNGSLDQATQSNYRKAYLHIMNDVTTDTQVVTASAGKIADLNIKVSFLGRLDQNAKVYLVSPSGTRVLLVSTLPQESFNVTCTFDDEAANPISSYPVFPIRDTIGVYRPEGLLSDFDGQDPNGTWTLEIDDSAYSGGILDYWTLNFTLGEMSTVTAADGSYSLEHLPAGAATIRQAPAANWSESFPTGGGYDVTLADGQVLPGLDFGTFPSAGKISGVKFLDSNGNGVRDAGEVGLAGWTIYADINENNSLDPGEPSAVTDANGNYVIPGVVIGQYAIAEVEQAGWARTTPGGAADPLYVCDGVFIQQLNPADYSIVKTFRLSVPESPRYLAIGNKSLFVITNSNNLYELNPQTGDVIDVDMLALDHIVDVAYLDNHLYVLFDYGKSIQVVDPQTDVFEAEWTYANPLRGLTGAADRGTLLSTCHVYPGDRLLTIDPSTGSIIKETPISLSPYPASLAYQNGQVILHRFPYRTLVRINPDTGLIEGSGDHTNKQMYIYLGGDGAVNKIVRVEAGQDVPVDFGGRAISTTPDLVDLEATSDTGLLNDDNLTRLNNDGAGQALQFTVSGVTPGATVWLCADNWNLIGSAVASGSTVTITADGTTILPDGPHTFTARQQMPGEAMSGFTAKLSVTVDTSAPLTPGAIDLQAASDSGVSSTDNVTNDNTPTFDLPSTPYFRMYRDGVLVSDPYATGSTFTSTKLKDGTYTFTMTAVDAAGNESVVSDGLKVTIDTVKPAISAFNVVSGTPKKPDGMSVSIQFSEDVYTDSMAGMLRLLSPAGKNVDLSAAVFSYDPATRTASWDLSKVPLNNGYYTARFATSGVQDLAGNVLNGGRDFVRTIYHMRQPATKGVTGMIQAAASSMLDLLAFASPLKLTWG